MATFKYYAAGRVRRFHAWPLRSAAPVAAMAAGSREPVPILALDSGQVANAIRSRSEWLGILLEGMTEADLLAQSDLCSGAVTLPTHSVIVDGASASEIRWLRDRHGFEVVREGRQGKVLLRSPLGGNAGV